MKNEEDNNKTVDEVQGSQSVDLAAAKGLADVPIVPDSLCGDKCGSVASLSSGANNGQ